MTNPDWGTIASLATAGGTLLPRDDGQWIASASRHHNVDRPDPR